MMPLFKDKCFKAHWINTSIHSEHLISTFLACQWKRRKIQRFKWLFHVCKTRIYSTSFSFFWNLQFTQINKCYPASTAGPVLPAPPATLHHKLPSSWAITGSSLVLNITQRTWLGNNSTGNVPLYTFTATLMPAHLSNSHNVRLVASQACHKRFLYSDFI